MPAEKGNRSNCEWPAVRIVSLTALVEKFTTIRIVIAEVLTGTTGTVDNYKAHYEKGTKWTMPRIPAAFTCCFWWRYC